MTTVLDEIADFIRSLFGPRRLPPPGVVPLHRMPPPPGVMPDADPYLAMASALKTRGYRRVDQPIYARAQHAAGLSPDGLPGPKTIDALVAYLLQHSTITLAGVKSYPFANQPDFFDGTNAPTLDQWMLGSPPAAVHPALPDLGLPAAFTSDVIDQGNAAAGG